MLLRRRVEGLNEALCPVCGEWRLLAHFEPNDGDLLPEICEWCRVTGTRN